MALLTEEQVGPWLAGVEAFHGVCPDLGTRSTCETGNRYVTVTPAEGGNGFVKEEGAPLRFYESEDLAWSMWTTAFECYLEGRGGRIYWRQRPVLIEHEGRFAVTARVFIADERS